MATKYHLGEVVKALFRLKNKWKEIDQDSKAASFFIINQYSAKLSPANAEVLNFKGYDPVAGMETWYRYFSDTRWIPDWFWAKPIKNKYETILENLTETDKFILTNYYKEDLNKYLQELEYKKDNSNIQTGKTRKNSKVSKIKDKYNTLF